MGKVLIVSDSHGLKEELMEIKKRHFEEVDAMIHCGDSELSISDEALDGFIVVRGNCDFESRFSKEHIQEIDGYRFYITHGHLYSVKSTLMKLSYRAEEINAQIICFGHSHMLGAEMMNGKLFINPGSIHHPRGRKEKTYIILELKDQQAVVRVFDREKGEIIHLKQNFHFPVNDS